MTNRFVGDRGGFHPLIYRREAVSDSHEGYREPIFRKPARDPKERDIYRADLKYKVPSGGRKDHSWSCSCFRKDRRTVTTLNSDRVRGSCLEIQRPRGRERYFHSEPDDVNANRN